MKDLETSNLRIRKFRMEDTEEIYKNLVAIDELEDCYNYNMYTSFEEVKMIIISSIREYELGEPVWAIEEKNTNIIIGYIKANEISVKNKICNLNFGIGVKWIDKGLLEEALEKVINFLMYEEGFYTIISKFYDGNEWLKNIKIKVLESIGMKQEAKLRNRKINTKTGRAENLIVYSILKEERNKGKIVENICKKAS